MDIAEDDVNKMTNNILHKFECKHCNLLLPNNIFV